MQIVCMRHSIHDIISLPDKSNSIFYNFSFKKDCHEQNLLTRGLYCGEGGKKFVFLSYLTKAFLAVLRRGGISGVRLSRLDVVRRACVR